MIKNRSAFSLIEILIVVGIAVSIVFVVSNLSTSVNLLNGFISQQLQSKSDIAQTLQLMTTEIRSAEISQNGAYPVDAASTSSFAFYSDINKDGTADHVRYFVSSTSLFKGVIAPTGTPATYPTATEAVADIIDNLIISTSTPFFSYYDSSYTGAQAALTAPIDISKIRLVGIMFNADIKPAQAPGPEYFSIMIDIRNLRSN